MWFRSVWLLLLIIITNIFFDYFHSLFQALENWACGNFQVMNLITLCTTDFSETTTVCMPSSSRSVRPSTSRCSKSCSGYLFCKRGCHPKNLLVSFNFSQEFLQVLHNNRACAQIICNTSKSMREQTWSGNWSVVL